MMLFPGGIEGTENGILLLSVAAALLYLPVLGRPPSLRRTAVKAGSIALLAVLAFEAGGPLPLIAALALCALGDAALAQDEERGFLAGLGCFFLAHIAYIVLFLRAGGGAAALAAVPFPGLAAVAATAFAGLMAVLLWRHAGAAFRLPVLAYAIAILAMVLSALTVPHPWIVAGALSFMASDALLAWGKFLSGGPEDASGARIAGWMLYYAAQLAITLAVLL